MNAEINKEINPEDDVAKPNTGKQKAIAKQINQLMRKQDESLTKA